MYYLYVQKMVATLARRAKSIIDVGSHDTSICETFDWIPKIHSLDIVKPYSSERVKGIKMNFFDFYPDEKYDFAVCLQVLEHIPDVQDFSKKLLKVAKSVLISVPYKWPEGSSKYHCNDPVDEEKLALWFGRKPDYKVVVKEPLEPGVKSRRLIAYFHHDPKQFDLKKYFKPRKRKVPAKSGVDS